MSASLQAVFLECKCKTEVGESLRALFFFVCVLQLLTIAGDLEICFSYDSVATKKDKGLECFFHPLLLFFGPPRMLQTKLNT